MKSGLLSIIFLFTSLTGVVAQGNAIIFFEDKNLAEQSLSDAKNYLSSEALKRRKKQDICLDFSDLPVSPSYLSQIEELDISVIYKSKWLNAVLVKNVNEEQKEVLNDMSFVKRVWSWKENTLAHRSAITAIQSDDFVYGYSSAAAQLLSVDQMHRDGYNGSGKLIAVFDAGFPAMPTIAGFSHLFSQNLVKDGYDFVNNSGNYFTGHSHGTSVSSFLTGLQDSTIIGNAYGAEYAFYITEDVSSETPAEMFNWSVAAEHADSIGADIINSSLGYNVFNNPNDNILKSELDGYTTIVSKAAVMAARKGILVVTSAGNEGGNSWNTLLVPADADSILAVGATDSMGIKAGFSSPGPSADGRIKPDVAAMGTPLYYFNLFGNISAGNGTSYAAPQIAGLAAGLWERFDTLTALELRDLIIRSSTQYQNPDSLIGYGVPNYIEALRILNLRPSIEPVKKINIKAYQQGGSIMVALEDTGFRQCDVIIYSPTGKKVLSQDVSFIDDRPESLKPDFNLSTGIYVIQIVGDNFTGSKKLLISSEF